MEFGGQFAGYLRDFSGGHIGVEVMWMHVNSKTFQGEQIEADAGGLAVGPFIGYKVLTEVGFTFVVQGGIQYVAVKGKLSDAQGNSARSEAEELIPLLNLNLGWSF
ncbi:MAG: hypothetical protein ACOY0T_36010 [Myxococcota bacterium]